MELLGAVAAALVAGVLLALGPPRDVPNGLRYAGVFLAALAGFSLFFPFVTAWFRYGAREAQQVAPGLTAAVAAALGSTALRLGVALLEGLALVTAKRHLAARPLVVAAGTLLPVLGEVVLKLDAIRTVAGVFPPLAVLDLLVPEVAPALLAGAVTSLWATRPGVS